MPVHIDIYILLDRRDQESIERFLNMYTCREDIEDLGDGELFILPKGKKRSEMTKDDYAWVPAKTLTSALNIGLSDTKNCFSLYLNSNVQGIENVIITFTQDAKLILGLSINEYSDNKETLENYDLANQLSSSLLKEFDGKASYFALEGCPADNEEDFFNEKKIWTPYFD